MSGLYLFVFFEFMPVQDIVKDAVDDDPAGFERWTNTKIGVDIRPMIQAL